MQVNLLPTSLLAELYCTTYNETNTMTDTNNDTNTVISATSIISELLDIQKQSLDIVETSNDSLDTLKITLLGRNSELSKITKSFRNLPKEDIGRVGIVANDVKKHIETAIEEKFTSQLHTQKDAFFDISTPGIEPPEGHLHIVTQAIMEITEIFSRIGFTRVRHPEVDWDYYAFEALNMPTNHPARDEWETFFVEKQSAKHKAQNDKYKQIVLTPHTSNGQVREMEKGKLPIRMINIAKCYRRQSDVSHAEMFHQFEGLYIDKNVSIAHLKGVIEYFCKEFYGPDRKIRLRPFHFQFTEPSFEIDVTCGLCHGTGMLNSHKPCRMCKEGWLELGGSGMVHPNVLKFGDIDTQQYNGFAFGWGVERTYMMKSGIKLDDIRLLYSNDVRFLEQF